MNCNDCDHKISWHHAKPTLKNPRTCYGIACQCSVLFTMKDICENCETKFDSCDGMMAFCSMLCAESDLQRMQGRHSVDEDWK